MAPREANPPHRPLSKLQAAAFDCLERGGVVVTGNARAARSLRHSHTAAQQARGMRAWSTPQIYDWESWLSVLWQQHLQNSADSPLLLTPLQERAVWKKIIGGAVSDSEAIAELTRKTWRLLSDFNAHGERSQPWRGAASSDSEVFRGWASSFDRQCRNHRWLSRSDLASFLSESIRKGVVEPPREILPVGFDRLTPAQQDSIEAARRAGTSIREPELSQEISPPQLVHAKDLRDELMTCAWWLLRKLEENPGASVAVIVQNVDEMRGEIHRIFREVLMPQSKGIENDEAVPFEFSLGVPLATVPVVKAALLALRWLVNPLDQAVISWLMISGFLAADGEDPSEMAQFDAELRKHARLPPETSLEAFLGYAPRSSSQSLRQFRGRLRALQREAEAEGLAHRRRTFPEWVAIAEKLLILVQWPGSRNLESVEFQARARWERLLVEVAALSFDGARISWAEFVIALERYASETISAPESRGVPIQIMGALESAGQDFDALWFLGVDDRRWPVPGSLNPLLPVWLQRKAHLPHSSMSEDWDLYLGITRRLASSALECMFSHALRDETGEVRSSALLREAFGSPLLTCSEQMRSVLGAPEILPHRRRTEEVEDESSIPWPEAISAGGADVLRRQSACAFQSFAVRRLAADELDTADRGLTYLDRGNLVHDVMNAFWSKPTPGGSLMRSRKDLFNAKVNGSLPGILDSHISEVFKERRIAEEGSQWSKAYLDIEKERLRTVLLQWLDYEMTRTDFTVEACEKESEADIGGLQLRLRVDRIDQVDGGRLILDYKTGNVSPAMWNGERPDEPQLPLYATHGQVDSLRGILFAQVRAGQPNFTGKAEDARKTVLRELPGTSGLIKSPLNEGILNEWSNALSNLAGQFLAGDAAVAPKSYPATCRYCPLPALCRVAETIVPIKAVEEEVTEDDEADEDLSLNG